MSVCAELGKNLPCGPSPSPFIVSGGISGLEMRFAFCQAISRIHQAPAAFPQSRAVEQQTQAVLGGATAQPSARSQPRGKQAHCPDMHIAM